MKISVIAGKCEGNSPLPPPAQSKSQLPSLSLQQQQMQKKQGGVVSDPHRHWHHPLASLPKDLEDD